MDGVQVGITNTPVEALEVAYPLPVERYALQPASGGKGQYRGGLGIERSVTLGTDATVSLFTERRRTAPHGIAGGEDGATGENLIDGAVVPAKTTSEIEAGTTVTVLTPGVGHGNPDERDLELESATVPMAKSLLGEIPLLIDHLPFDLSVFPPFRETARRRFVCIRRS